MDVKFITVRKSNLNAVPVVDGQVLALEDANGMYYDMNSKRYRVSSIRMGEEPNGIGYDGEIFVAKGGDTPGVYMWDDASKSYVLIANKDTDTYLTVLKSTDLDKVYVLGFNGNSESKDIHWNENVHMDFVNGTITANEFKGKSLSSYNSDNSEHSKESDHSLLSDVSSKIGTDTVGDSFTAVYILNGVPTTCSHTVKKDVPEDAVFTDTTYVEFVGSTTDSGGKSGLVPAPATNDSDKFLKGDGTWSEVVIPDMVGCSSTSDGTHGLVPYPSKGKYNSFLKGDGTWANYSAGAGLDLVSLTFNLADSGVQPGSYGPMPNAENMTVYSGEYIPVPHITVDKYGRVTSIEEVMCYAGGGGSTPGPTVDASLMKFSMTPDQEHLLCTYEDLPTALATYDIDDEGDMLAEYQYDPTPATVHIDDNGHVIATPVSKNVEENTEGSSND